MTYSGSPNPDPGDIRANEEMLQREREEKAEQERIEEERRILEEEVPYYRRQRQLESGDFIEDPEGPHYQSIAAETGIGIAADLTTVGLLGIPLVGQGLYYGINFGVGYGANALAQWMRGDWDEFSHGEALAAGGFQTIPMGTTLKGLKGLRRAAVKGAVGGAGMAQLEVGIDERRRLTAQELMLSSILGGTIAGGFKSAELAPGFVSDVASDLSNNPYSKYRPFTNRLGLTEAGTVGAMRRPSGTGGFGNPFQKKVFQRTYSKSFAKGRGGFNYNEWKGFLREHLGDTKAKYSLESFQTRDTQFVRQFFNKQKRALKPAFLEEYGEWMAKNDINPDTLELHHIFGVMQSAGLYDGLEHMDEGWRLVTDIMNKNGLFPGAPATLAAEFSNFKYVTKELHDILHHQFLTKKLGIDGSKFFDKRILYNGKKMKRIDIINSGLEGRGFIAKEYAKIVAEGRDLMDEGLLQMEALFSKSGIRDTDVLVKVLSKATDKGDIFLGNTDLLLESVNKELKAIAKDINWTDAEREIGKKGLETFGIDNTRREIKKKFKPKNK